MSPKRKKHKILIKLNRRRIHKLYHKFYCVCVMMSKLKLCRVVMLLLCWLCQCQYGEKVKIVSYVGLSRRKSKV